MNSIHIYIYSEIVRASNITNGLISIQQIYYCTGDKPLIKLKKSLAYRSQLDICNWLADDSMTG